MAIGKRGRVSRGGRRNVRRRLFGRKKRTGRRGKFGRSTAFTSQYGKGATIAYRSKRIRPASYRRMLWNATQMKAHYRSNGADSIDVVTQASAALLTISRLEATGVGLNPFWTVAGGATPLDQGIAVPPFKDDIILRGGKVGISFYNNATAVPITVNLLLVKNVPRPSFANIPATAAMGWDFTHVPEFHKDIAPGIIYQTALTIRPDQVGQAEFRLKPMKIDQEAWSGIGSDNSMLRWLFTISDYGNTATNTVRCTRWHNLSFSGDAF